MKKDVIALKFRPQTFEEFVGQKQVTIPLQNAIKKGNIYPAYLFFGPRGVGKTSAARILAKMLNCKNGPIEKPCNKCENCVEISKGVSPDVIEIDGASNRGINEIRELQENIRYAPLKSRYKIYIIDEVHMLTKEAFNALLKTLEEPPEHVIFIFATTEVHKVLPTIRSRTQQYNFNLFRINEIIQHIKKILSTYNLTYEEKALYWIAKFANGSMRDALSLLSQVIAYNDKEIKVNSVLYILGIEPFENLKKIFNFIINNDTKNLIINLKKIYNSGINTMNFVQQLMEFIRLIILVKNDISNEDIEVLEYEDLEFLKIISKHYNTKTLIKMIEKLIDFQKSMILFSNPYPYLENLLLSFIFFKKYIEPSEIIEEIEKIKKSIFELFNEKNIKLESITIEQVESKLQENYPDKNLKNLENEKIDQSNNMKEGSSSIEIKKTEPLNQNNKKASSLKSVNTDNKTNLINEEVSRTLKYAEKLLKENEIKESKNENKFNNNKNEIGINKNSNPKKDPQLSEIINKLNNIKNHQEKILETNHIPEQFKKLAKYFDGEYIIEEEEN